MTEIKNSIANPNNNSQRFELGYYFIPLSSPSIGPEPDDEPAFSKTIDLRILNPKPPQPCKVYRGAKFFRKGLQKPCPMLGIFEG